LTSCVPEREFYFPAVNDDVCDIVLEDGWDVTLSAIRMVIVCVGLGE
jgi:hypothetical protein